MAPAFKLSRLHLLAGATGMPGCRCMVFVLCALSARWLGPRTGPCLPDPISSEAAPPLCNSAGTAIERTAPAACTQPTPPCPPLSEDHIPQAALECVWRSTRRRHSPIGNPARQGAWTSLLLYLPDRAMQPHLKREHASGTPSWLPGVHPSSAFMGVSVAQLACLQLGFFDFGDPPPLHCFSTRLQWRWVTDMGRCVHAAELDAV